MTFATDTSSDTATVPGNNIPSLARLQDAKITRLDKIYDRSEHVAITFSDWLDEISSDRHKDVIQNMRQLYLNGDKEAYSKQKKTLPASAVSGLFYGKVDNANFAKHSGVMPIDIDHLSGIGETPESIKHRLANDNSIVAIYTTPSGNGVKVYVHVPEIKNDADYKAIFALIEAYFLKLHGLVIDPSGKDVARLSFVSHDPDIYKNYSTKVIDLSGIEVAAKPPGVVLPGFGFDDGGAILEGGRNTTLHKIGSKVRGQGGGFDDVLAAVEQANFERCKPPLDAQEVLTIVNSVMNYPTNAEKAERDGKTTKFDTSEVGMAEYFRDSSEGKIRYVVEYQQFVVWDDTNKQWRADGTGEIVVKKVKEFLDCIQKIADKDDE